MHDYLNYLSIDSDEDQEFLFASTDCGFSMPTREGFPMLDDNIWKIDKYFQQLTTINVWMFVELQLGGGVM